MKIPAILLPLLSAGALSGAYAADEMKTKDGMKDSGRPLSTALTGAAEVPGPGDTDGSGGAEIRINPGQTELCYSLSVTGIDAATAAHIHKGVAGQAGPVVVPLTAPATGKSKGCATITRELAKEIIANPADYYVNVHNAAFPGGAVRGQLGK